MDNRAKREAKEAEEKLDSRQKYRKRVEAEEEQGKINRKKREKIKETKKLKIQLEIKRLNNHSTGLITWKRKGNIWMWEGYVDEKKCFQIKQGIFKYSLYVDVDTGDKKDKNIKTSFELLKLQTIAESIVKKVMQNEKNNKKSMDKTWNKN